MGEYIPKEYRIEIKEGKTVFGHENDRLVHEKTGGYFFLTNRTFKEIDHSFAHLPSMTISKLRRVSQEEPIRILDIGGGINAQSAGDIADKYRDEQDERIQVFSLDMTARKKDRAGLYQIVGNVLELPIKDNSIDMAYSRMSVSVLEESDPDTLQQALRETARVLKSGGLLFLDKTYTEQLEKTLDLTGLNELSENLGVVFYSKKIGLFLGPLERFLNKLNKKYPDWKFIIMVKEPIDEELLRGLKLKEKDRLT